MHLHLSDNQFLAGGFVFVLGIVIALAAFFEKRKAKAPSFPNYFCYEYDQSLLDDGDFEEADGSLAERPSGV